MFGQTSNAISISRAAHKAKNEFAFTAARPAEPGCNISLLEPANYLSDEEYCYASKDQRPLYYDNVHLSIYGAKTLEPIFLHIPR